MLSTAINAQQLYFYDAWTPGTNFDIVVTDVTDDQVTFDMTHPDGYYFWTAVYHANLDMFTGPWMEYYFLTNQNMGQYYNNNDFSLGFNDVDGTIAYLTSLVEECPEDLTPMLDACQASNAGLSAAVSAQGAQINDLTSSVDSLQALLDQANAVIANLATENEDLATDLYECQSNLDDCSTDLAVVQGQAANCAQLYNDYQWFYVQETNALNAEIGDLEDELDGCEDANEGLNLQVIDLYDVLNFADSVANATIDSLQAELDAGCTFEQSVIDAALAVNAELNDEVDTLQALLNSANAELDGCEAGQDLLTEQLAECDSVAIAEVDYWMDNYYDAVAEGNAYIDSLNAIISTVPDAIEDAVDQALEECADNVDAAYDQGVADTTEDNMLSDEELQAILLDVYATAAAEGYAAGLEDCEGSIDGIIDMGGTLVTTVTGYYNTLGQAINPDDANGIIIIRKHADGTFSKYFKQ